MKKIFLAAFLLTAFFTNAQRNFTIQEATFPQQYGFAVESLVNVQWKDNQNITYLDAKYQNLWIRNVMEQESKLYLSAKELQIKLNEQLHQKISLTRFPYSYKWVSSQVIEIVVPSDDHNYKVLYDVVTQKVVKSIAYPAFAQEEDFASDYSFVVWLKDNNLMLTNSKGDEIQITHDPKGIINGSGNTHRNEFGIHKGFWISPDNKKILFYSKDETMVSDYPLVNFGSRVAETKEIKYPMAGMASEEVSLKVYDIEKGNITTLNIDGPKDQFLTMPTWTPDSQNILVGVLNREQNHLKVQNYHAHNGLLAKTLFEQKDAAYVEPSHHFRFLPNQKDQFIYVTDKDGYRQMYLYNLQGNLIKKLGFEDVVFKEIVDVDNKNIYYMGTANKGMDTQLYRVEIKSGKTVRLTQKSGVHTAKINPSKTMIYDQYTNATTLNKLAILDAKGAQKIELLNSKNPYEGKINIPKVEYVSIKAADGVTDLNGRLTYPVDFDANKKYPVMVYVYGGPHAQLVVNRYNYGAGGFDYYMAQQGFVVFTLDNRGSDNRGKNFEQVIHRNLGQNEMADQMKGVEFLKSQSFVDAERIGVYGWSFGGFMTTSLMLNYPETFKVGVAGGPVIDWKWYEVMYGERYMDTPQENPEGYELTSTLNKVANLKGRLLIIHGAQDPVVVQQHSMEFIEKCIKEGKQVDYFLYPAHEHNVLGKDRTHLNEKIADYFLTHLK